MSTPGALAPSDAQLTAAEIAELAGVGRAAVSNWRRRFDDFPNPVAVAPGGGDLFRLADVEAWLRGHDRLGGQVGPEKALWRAFDSARSRAPVERIVEVACAFIGLLTVDRAQHVQEWVGVAPGDLARAVAQLAKRVGQEHPELEELFTPLTNGDTDIGQLLWALMPLTAQTADLGTGLADVFEAVLDRRERLRVYGGAESESAKWLADLLVRLAKPAGTVFDPAAGEGGFLLSAVGKNEFASSGLRLVGQEINDQTRRIARLRFLVHRVPVEILPGDSLLQDALPDLRADVVFCEPPFGMRWRQSPNASDPRWFAGPPSEGSADLSWVQHVIHHLAAAGRGYITLPTGALFGRGRESTVRRELVRRGCVEAVVALPAGLIRGSSVPISLWIVRRPDTEPGPPPVLLINAAGAGREDRAALDESLMAKIVSSVKRFRQNPSVFKPEPRFASAISVLQLLARDATLFPAHWITEGVMPSEALTAITNGANDLVAKQKVVAAALVPPPFEVALMDTNRTRVKVRDLLDGELLELIKGGAIPRDAILKKGTPVLVSPWSRLGDERQRFVDLKKLKRNTRLTEPGDVVVIVVGEVPRAFIDEVGGNVLPDFMMALRIKRAGIDPMVLAGLISAPANARFVVGATIPRLSLLEVEVPVLTEEETATLRDMLKAVSLQESAAKELSRSAADLRDNILDAFVAGQIELRPKQEVT